MLGTAMLIAALAFGDAMQGNSAQLSQQQVEEILFDFRVGVDWQVKNAGIERLVDAGDTFVPVLIECLNWKLPPWLQERLEKSQEPGRPIAMRADRSSMGIQDCAETALTRIGKPAVPHLIASFQSQPETIGSVARILGKIGDARAIPPLIRILESKDQNWWSRCEAACALQMLDAQEAVPCLIDSLSGQPDDPYNSDKLADAVANALALLTGRSLGFAVVVAQVDMAWNVAPRYTIRGTPEERKAIIAQWKQWWERQSMLRGQVERSLAQYVEYLKAGDAEKIKTMRSADYVRRIKGGKRGFVVVDCLRGEWFDMIERKKASLPACKEYQVSLLNCRFEGERAILTSRDKALVVGDVEAWFAVIFERVFEKQGDSWVVREENLLTWERPQYGG